MAKINTINELLVRPMSWSSVNPRVNTMQANPSLFPSIQIFGYTSDGRTVYLRLPRKSTFILKFAHDVDDDTMEDINEILSPSYIKYSDLDPKVMVVHGPELSPIELANDPKLQSIATWIEAKQDPYGEVESLWEARGIQPYDWISVRRYSPLPGKYTNSDLNIRTEEDYIFAVPDDVDLPYIVPRLFFWDIETFSSRVDQFPDPTNIEDCICMISVLTVDKDGTNGYVFVKGNTQTRAPKDAIVVQAKDEKDLFTKFFALYNTFKPDRHIYYNGDMFDMPYLLDRVDLLKFDIPHISKVLSATPCVTRKFCSTLFGRRMLPSLAIPGTETIDLVHYFKKFYPHLRNHKLDTVSKFIIGKGKSGLTIEELMTALSLGTNLDKAVEYSFTDSLRLTELWEQAEIQDNMDAVCNNLRISSDTLLHSDSIIDQAVYNIDPTTVFMKGPIGSPSHLKEAVKGIYRDVYIYDYSALYRYLMLISDQPVAKELAKRLEGAPPHLIVEAFYSAYIVRSDQMVLSTMLDSINNNNSIIAIEPFIIRSTGPLHADWLLELEHCPFYVSVSKASYIIINDELESVGLSKLARPKFKLAADTIKNYLSSIFYSKEFSMPDPKTMPNEDFILTERLEKGAKVTKGTVKEILTLQYNKPIVTWTSVKYLITLRGPVLLSQIKSDDVIDYNYYTKELEKYISELQNMKR